MTDAQLEILFTAWAMAPRGVVIEDTAYPEAHELAERGWLERHFEPDGEMSWHWTPAADVALGLGGLTSDAIDNANCDEFVNAPASPSGLSRRRNGPTGARGSERDA